VNRGRIRGETFHTEETISVERKVPAENGHGNEDSDPVCMLLADFQKKYPVIGSKRGNFEKGSERRL